MMHGVEKVNRELFLSPMIVGLKDLMKVVGNRFSTDQRKFFNQCLIKLDGFFASNSCPAPMHLKDA